MAAKLSPGALRALRRYGSFRKARSVRCYAIFYGCGSPYAWAYLTGRCSGNRL